MLALASLLALPDSMVACHVRPVQENPVYLAWQERERIARGEMSKTAAKKGKR